MGILFKALLGTLFGPDTTSKYADPNCPFCRGSGYAGTAVGCFCVSNGIAAAATEYRQQREQRLAEEALAATPRGPAVDISGFDVVVVELSPAQKEQQRIEAKVRMCVNLQAKQAIDAGRLTMCCASNPCKCGVNHWVQNGGVLGSVPPPTEGTPNYDAWLRHRSFVDGLQVPRPTGYWDKGF